MRANPWTGFAGARDGVFGNQTKNGIEAWEDAYGSIQIDGIVRQLEWELIRDEIFYVDTDGISARYHAGLPSNGIDNFYRRNSSGRWFIEDSTFQAWDLCCLVGLRTHVHTI